MGFELKPARRLLIAFGLINEVPEVGFKVASAGLSRHRLATKTYQIVCSNVCTRARLFHGRTVPGQEAATRCFYSVPGLGISIAFSGVFNNALSAHF
jgi:hypothetical protein